MKELVKLTTATPDAEKFMGYVARVSNPANQDNPDVSGLLKYCIRNQHWSVFETASITMEISTSRAIAAQILRHRSFTFQEFSQRYASPSDFEVYEARRQDTKNRQNSTDDLSAEDKEWFITEQKLNWDYCKSAYDAAIARGIAKECARFLLPMSVSTKLYMTGSVRSWIHYIELRTKQGTQLEHKLIADECKKIFGELLPTIAQALEWQA
jgi:thymidylate synthase (FAD)